MIDILLATYNGEKYIAEQIESLQNQTYKNIRILIRDDNSTDRTLEIINEMMLKYDNINLISDNKKCGSPQKNFIEILKHADADYVMFCDQDDIWLENKVEISYKAIKKYDNLPAMASTDFYLVDENLNHLPKKGLQTNKKTTNFSTLLVDNCYMGCTLILNKKLYSLVDDIPTECLMHDIWFALLASSMGKIINVDEKCMLYRQHANNCVGGKSIYSISYIIDRIMDRNTKNNFKILVKQAKGFASKYYTYLNDYNKKILKIFINIYKYNKFQRIYYIFKYNLKKRGLHRLLGEIFYLFIEGKKNDL